MVRQGVAAETRGVHPRDRALLGDLLSNVRYAPFWLVPRVVLGWLTLQAGWSLLRELPAPVGQGVSGSGANGALAIGLTLAGIALILGAMTGLAALVAGFLSVGLWAGQGAVVAVIQVALAAGLVLGWKSAGWIGLDRWLLPALGVPGRSGALVRRESAGRR